MPKIPPLYKYRSLSGDSRKWTENIIRNSSLWYSRASAFNDPFDCNLMIAGKEPGEWEAMLASAFNRAGDKIRGVTAAAFRKYGEKVPERLKPRKDEKERGWQITFSDKQGNPIDLNEYLNSLQSKRMTEIYRVLDENFGVLSLSSKPDNILMWSHYADNHKGICLEFHPSAHPKAFPRLHPVQYKQQYPYLDAHFPDVLLTFLYDRKKAPRKLLLDLANVLAEDLSDDSGSDNTRKLALGLAQWFYVKSQNWEYEQEWRALSDQPGDVRFTKRALKGIIVGCVDSAKNIEWARRITDGRRPKITLYKAVKKHREFGLDIVPV